MKKSPKVSKTPHPSEVEGNGHFQSDGGFSIYSLLWNLQGRMGRVEGIVAIGALLIASILGLLVKILLMLMAME